MFGGQQMRDHGKPRRAAKAGHLEQRASIESSGQRLRTDAAQLLRSMNGQ
jgi:hypothetical protein